MRQISSKESKTEPAGSSNEYLIEGVILSWFAIGACPTTVHRSNEAQPTNFLLDQNYPTPFNPTTKISYIIAQLAFVALKVYDIVGRDVQTLIKEFQQFDRYSFNFYSIRPASGVYFYKLQAGNNFS